MKKTIFLKLGLSCLALLIFAFGLFLFFPPQKTGFFGSGLKILLYSVPLSVILSLLMYPPVSRLIDLYDKISKRYNLLLKSNAELEKKLKDAIDAFSSPVLLVDRFGKIVSENMELRNLLGAEENLAGKNYLEFFKIPDFIEAVHSVMEKSSPLKKEIPIKGRRFSIVFTPFRDTKEVVVSFKEITVEKELERVKRDLITNMSHELKTPLTAIKGYTETLLGEEADRERKRYLEVIQNNTDRLINIIQDILSLAELEEDRFSSARVDIKEIISDVINMFSHKAGEKNLYLKSEQSNGDLFVEGDRFKLEEMFINLVDNAVKYTDKGGILIKSRKTGAFAEIIIKDTGIGIPEIYLPRIFERFYVVDKSRSKTTGGTGLGLSIVKHIVLLHKGEIDIKSSLNKGTEVIIKLPQVNITNE